MPVRTYESRIDLCHSGDDREFARLLTLDLRNAGAAVRRHEASCREVEEPDGRHGRPADCSEHRVVVMSPSSVNEPWMREALTRGVTYEYVRRGTRIHAALKAPCRLPSLPDGSDVVDFGDGRDYEDAFLQLLKSLRRCEDVRAVAGPGVAGLYPRGVTVDPLPGYAPRTIAQFCRFFESLPHWEESGLGQQERRALVDEGLIAFCEYYDYGQWGYELTAPGCRMVERVYGRRVRPCPRGYVESGSKALACGDG